MSVQAKMTAIADAIREKTGNAALLGLDDMAENIPKVYESGQEAVRIALEPVNTQLEDVLYGTSSGGKSWYDTFWDAVQDNGNRTDYTMTFAGKAWNDTTFRPKYDINPDWAVVSMFQHSRITDLESILNECGVTLNIRNNANFSSMFASASFTVLPILDFSGFPNNFSLYDTFGNCKVLHTIRKVILPETTTRDIGSSAFNGCSALANIEFNVIPSSLDMHYSPLTKASFTGMIHALHSSVTGKTLTLSVTAVNTAFETTAGAADGSTSQEWADLIATKANWTISLV